MYIVTIGGKQIHVNPTYRHLQYAVKKYYDVDSSDMKKYDKYIFDMLWKMIVRKNILKPYVTKYNMINNITLSELQRLRIDVHRMLCGLQPITDKEYEDTINNYKKNISEDKEKKNVKKNQENIREIIL